MEIAEMEKFIGRIMIKEVKFNTNTTLVLENNHENKYPVS